MIIAVIVIACIVAALVIAFAVWRIVRKVKLVKKLERELGVKLVRRTFAEWLRAHKPTKRKLIQFYATLLYNANIKGYITGSIYTSATTKYACVPGLNCYSCPGAVGACPLGALQNAMAASGTRAPYYVLGILALFGVIFARTICGFLCPVGLGQELLYKIRTPKLKKSRVTRVLSYFKYVLLAVLVIIIPLLYALRDVPLPGFCKYICPAGTIGGAIGLLLHPDNADMFDMLGGQFTWKFSLLVLFIVAAIFIYRFFCRFFCPLGAIYGFFNRIALIGVKVDKNNCTDCGKCVTVCKMDIRKVGDHECINCGECISSCPTKAISWKGSKIFLHKDQSASDTATEKPLSALMSKPNIAVDTSTTVTAAQTCSETVREAQLNGIATISEDTGALEAQTAPEKKERKKRPAAFWVELTAWIVALALLVTALVYYNFIDVEKNIDTPPPIGDLDVGFEVGKYAPDFTVKILGSDETFNLYSNRGKVTVINFWATWCTPCVQEIPHFDEVAAARSDVTVIAIHGSSSDSPEDMIASKWSDHTLIFAQDNIVNNKCQTYLSLGGKSTWPMTLILDEEGKILYNSTKSFESARQLSDLIDSLTIEE